MKKVKEFIKDWKKEGLKYAIATAFMFTFENSKVKALRKFSDRCYDYSMEIYEQTNADLQGYDEEWEEESFRTPCGNTIFDCEGCNSYPICSQYSDTVILPE